MVLISGSFRRDGMPRMRIGSCRGEFALLSRGVLDALEWATAYPTASVTLAAIVDQIDDTGLIIEQVPRHSRRAGRWSELQNPSPHDRIRRVFRVP